MILLSLPYSEILIKGGHLNFYLIRLYSHFIDLTNWIDVCPNNGNLLAAGGYDKNIKVYDHRESKVVKTFDGIHLSKKYHLA